LRKPYSKRSCKARLGASSSLALPNPARPDDINQAIELVTEKLSQRTDHDRQRLKVEHPTIYQAYSTKSPSLTVLNPVKGCTSTTFFLVNPKGFTSTLTKFLNTVALKPCARLSATPFRRRVVLNSNGQERKAKL